MKLRAWILVTAGALLLGACSSGDVRQGLLPSTISSDIDAARSLPPPGATWTAVLEQPANGTSFNAWLSRDYKALMLFEVDDMYDYISGDMYARRSLAAANGANVELLPLEAFNLPAEHLPALTQARADVLELFGRGAREKFPREAARLQSDFDCWVEQQEENHQPDHIARCRDEFIDSLRALRAAMTSPPPAEPMAKKAEPPAPKAEPRPMLKESYIVYFAFDSAKLSADARSTVDEVVRALKAQNAGASIIGYTDTAGPAAYNQALSEKRAQAVTKLLFEVGIRPAVVTAEGRGETGLATPTADNVKEPTNRRVVINIR